MRDLAWFLGTFSFLSAAGFLAGALGGLAALLLVIWAVSLRGTNPL